MAKSTNLALELTESEETLFEDWRNAINGNGTGENKSNAQLIDEFAGKFAGGSVGKMLVKKSNGDFDFEWQEIYDNGATAIVENSGAVIAIIEPDKFYSFTGELTSLAISLGNAVSGRENEYKGQFSTGNTAPTVTFPSSIVWVGGNINIEANKTYQFSILNGIGVLVGV